MNQKTASGALAGKSAFITGGTSGIGRAIALRFAAEGATVDVAARTSHAREGGEDTDAMIRAGGGKSTYYKLDVSDPASVSATINSAVAARGKLDILVCSHGAIGAAGDSRQVDAGEFSDQFTVDVRGAFLCARETLKHLMDAGNGGKIVFVSSNFAFVGVTGLAAYCASKAAVVALARSLASEYGPAGININALCPGATATATGDSFRTDPAIIEKWKQMTPLRIRDGEFIADVDGVAEAALFLASASSRFMTGAALVVDGGWTAV